MNNTDKEYQRLLQLVLDKGKVKKNRTGIDTLGVFGAQARFDLSEGFPLLTTKKVFMKGIVHELLWFLSGSTNIKYLVDNGVNIWNGNCYDRFRKKHGVYKVVDNRLDQDLFIEQIKRNEEFAAENGELGEGTYGSMWRGFPYYSSEDMEKAMASPLIGDGWEMPSQISFVKKVDQIQKVIDKLKSNPDDRRLIVSAWHPYFVDHCCLPPCHVLFQFHTEELTDEERLKLHYEAVYKKRRETGKYIPQILKEKLVDWDSIPTRRLNCQLYQRSLDLPLGGPFNIASYALLLTMVAHCVNMTPGEFVWSIGDCHIYKNQIEGIKEQLKREPRKLPKLHLNPEIKNIFDFKYEDIHLEGYDPHPAIKMDMAV